MAATVSDLTNIVYSGDYRADALLDNPAWNYFPDGRNVLYFTFDVSGAPAMGNEAWQYGDSAFNSTQQTAARQVLAYVQQLTGIRFMEVAGAAQADVHFASVNIPGSSVAGLAYSGYSYNYDGNGVIRQLTAETMVYLDNVEHAGINTNPTVGTVGYEVLLHEVGHMLGLVHPFDSPRPLPAALDNTSNTVMSYTDQGAPKSQFQSYDVLALTWLYGGDGLGGTWGLNSANGPTLALPSQSVRFVGTALPDVFVSLAANEFFDGAGGIDKVVFDGARAGYGLLHQGSSWQVADSLSGRDGTDSLKNIERLQFADMSLALDLNGAAGTTARLLGVMLGEASLANRALVGAVLGVVDAGVADTQLAGLALQAVFGGAVSNAAVVAHVYKNLFHVAPDAATLRTLTAFLDSGAYSQSDLVVLAAGLDANASNIGLVGLAAQGLEFV